jgi:nucleotide-binding universal stress UspA family protein
MQIRRILCSLDFSEPSRSALAQAIRIARAHGSEIDALHVAPLLSPSSRPAEMEAGLRSIEEAGITAHGHVCSGDPAMEIMAYAEAHDVDLIVLGTHGRDGVARLLLGSVAETVLRKAGCPVITVSPAAGEPAATGPFQRILCPIDLSPLSRRALGHALWLGRQGQGQVAVLYVIGPAPSREVKGRVRRTVAGYERFIEAQMKAQLEDIGSPTERLGCRPRRMVRAGEVWREILAGAAEIGADLIVMGVHGRSALDVMLSGSATKEVVRRAGCPVFTVGAPRGGQHGLVPAHHRSHRLFERFDQGALDGRSHRARW